MSNKVVLFEVNYGRRFKSVPHIEYVGGKKNLYHEPSDMDYFSCIRFNTLFPYSYMGGSTQVENPQVRLIL